MCGRFAFYSPAEATAALFGVQGAAPLEPRYNIAPTRYIAAVRESAGGQRELTRLRWGLVPFWAKDAAIGNRMINARAETVAEKPAYRAAFRERRCIVLADGFYEWRKSGDADGSGTKTPYFIAQASGEPFGIAALWERWRDRESGEDLETATLITTAANAFLEPVHHRMPLIVTPAMAGDWFTGDAGIVESLAASTPAMAAWPVGRRVNNASNEDSGLIEAAGAPLGA